MNNDFATLLVEHVPVGIGVWDADGASSWEDLRLIYVNRWADENLMRGFPGGVGLNVRELREKYNREPNAHILKHVFETAMAQHSHSSETGEFGTGRVFKVHYKPLGHIVAAAIFEDVTEAHQANAKLAFALESAKAGMWWYDLIANEQNWDAGAATLLGLGERKTLRTPDLALFLGCIHQDDAGDVEQLLRRSIETPGVESVELEFRLARESHLITVMDRVRIQRNDFGVATHVTHVIIDITDKAHLTDQLTQSNSDLKNFAHVASHDLREPLRVIINYVTLLFEESGDKLDSPNAKQYREFIETSSVRAMALVDDLLRFSRAGNNMNPKTVSLSMLVQIAAENLKMAIDETDAELIIPQLPEVTCDAGMMVQVFQNLIGNALKFTGDTLVRPRVEIGVEDLGDSWKVSIADTGVGIEDEYLSKIFTPFYRLYTTAEYPGTGIGLALCQKIVRAHGGDIWAESGGRGHGTTLLFTLPKT